MTKAEPAAGALLELRVHGVTLRTRTLRGLPVVLRPMTEGDWALLERWNGDPAVLHFAEEDDVASRSPEDIREMYRDVSRTGLTFVIEADGLPVGGCWLQAMNLPAYRDECRGRDWRRIDVMIGDRASWGRGIGTAAVAELTRHAFLEAGADAVFLCGAADYNLRSLAVARRLGYRLVRIHDHPPGGKMRRRFDYRLLRAEYPCR